MPRRLDADEPTVVAIAKVPQSLDAAIVRFQKKQRLPNKSAALRALLERGLNSNGDNGNREA